MSECQVCKGTGIAEYADQYSPVTIPRAQYEALMAAAEALANLVPRFEKACEIMGNVSWATAEVTKRHRINALAALRAAGIPEGE